MTKPIKLVSISMADHFRESLRELGFEEVNPNRFVKIDTDGLCAHHVWSYVDNAWRLTTEMLVGIKVLDDPEELLL